MIKLDIPGAELDVLSGAERILSQALLVESEVEFQSVRREPLFRDIDAFMAKKGWALLGLRRDFWRRTTAPSADGGTLAHGDVLDLNPARLQSVAEEIGEAGITTLAAYRQADQMKKSSRRESAGPMGQQYIRGSGVDRTQRLVGEARSCHQLGARHTWQRRHWTTAAAPTPPDWHDADFF